MVLINQIYHTSHCGSTLLAYLISYSTSTYSEPDWFIDFLLDPIENDTTKLIGKLSEFDSECCIKFPNQMCDKSKHILGKKVFLYRKLQDHLHHMHDNGYVYLIYPGERTDYSIKNLHHHLIQFIELCDTDLKRFCLFWADNFLHMKDCEDVLYIESNYFFLNRESVVKDVLNYFGIEEGKTNYSRIDAKSYMDNKIVPVSENYGVIDRNKTPKEVKETIIWFRNIFGDLLENYL